VTPSALEFWDNVGGLRLLMAMRTLALDVTAKEIAAQHLKKVLFVNVDRDEAYSVQFDVATGLLKLACQFDRATAPTNSRLLSNDEIFTSIMAKLDIRASQQRKELQERLLPGRESEIADVLGHQQFRYRVDYSSFPSDDELNYIDNVVCHRVSMALRCTSGADKDRIAQKLQSIEIKNVANQDSKQLAYAAGVFTLTVALAFRLDGAFSDNEIRAFLCKEVK
jgi:hypothetical protein